jgi:hypothetical protein
MSGFLARDPPRLNPPMTNSQLAITATSSDGVYTTNTFSQCQIASEWPALLFIYYICILKKICTERNGLETSWLMGDRLQPLSLADALGYPGLQIASLGTTANTGVPHDHKAYMA